MHMQLQATDFSRVVIEHDHGMGVLGLSGFSRYAIKKVMQIA